MKKYNVIRIFLYLIAGVAILVLNGQFVKNGGELIPYLVGAVILFYGANKVIRLAFTKKVKEDLTDFCLSIIMALLGVFTVVFALINGDTIYVSCIIWAVWSIIKEGIDISEKVIKRLDNIPVAIINAINTAIILVFSAIMIIDPLAHAHTHVILLGTELFVESLTILLTEVFTLKKKQDPNVGTESQDDGR